MQEVERITDGDRADGPGDALRHHQADDRGGLLEEADERPDPALDDERRRYYRAHRLGRAVLEAETGRMATLVGAARAKRVRAR